MCPWYLMTAPRKTETPDHWNGYGSYCKIEFAHNYKTGFIVFQFSMLTYGIEIRQSMDDIIYECILWLFWLSDWYGWDVYQVSVVDKQHLIILYLVCLTWYHSAKNGAAINKDKNIRYTLIIISTLFFSFTQPLQTNENN